jgi:hypothetical protein
MRKLVQTVGVILALSVSGTTGIANAQPNDDYYYHHHHHHHHYYYSNGCYAHEHRAGAIGAVTGAVGGGLIGGAITHGAGGALLGAGAGALLGNTLARHSARC